MTPGPTILEAIDNPAIWRSWFRDVDTWRPWRAFLSAMFGLPLDEYALDLFCASTGRESAPEAPFNEAWLIVGRRGGKSFVLALIAVFLAVFRDWSDCLAPGESATVKVVATDRRQARVILRYMRALIAEVPALANLIDSETDDEIVLRNGITIEVQTANFRSIRGYTIIALLGDEIAYWRSEETAANPDREILNAARAAQATLHGRGVMLLAGSPYARRGEQYRAFRDHWAKPSSVLVWKASTRTMNPSVPQEFIDAEYDRDPESAAAEYGAEFRSDLADYIPREVVDAAVVPGRFELPPAHGIDYVAAIDVSGGSVDSMTLSIAHAGPDSAVILDLVRETRPPFNAEAVAAEYAELCRRYAVSRVIGDRYGGQWPQEAIARYGVSYAPAEQPKSDFYKDLLPLLTSGKAELLDNARLIGQLASLERRTARGGRDSIDHPPGAHDDVANAAAIALCLASTTAAPAIFRHADMLAADNAPIAWPVRCTSVFATVSVDLDGLFTGYWANAGHYSYQTPRLLLIDYARPRITPTLWADVATRLQELRDQTAVGQISLAFISPELHSAALSAGVDYNVRAPAAILDLQTRAETIILCAAQIGQGHVKLTSLAAERAAHMPNPIAALRPGAPPSAPLDAALLAISAALPPEAHPAAWRGKL